MSDEISDCGYIDSRFTNEFFKGYPIEYHYFRDNISVTWESFTTAIVRFHIPDSKPEVCEFYGTCFLKLTKDGGCEVKALVRDPGPAVHRALRHYLKYVRLKGFYRRLRKGKIVTIWYK